MYPYGQVSQTLPSGQGYTTMHGYAMPGHQIMQFGGPSVNALTTSPMPTIQAPYPTGKISVTKKKLDSIFSIAACLLCCFLGGIL